MQPIVGQKRTRLESANELIEDGSSLPVISGDAYKRAKSSDESPKHVVVVDSKLAKFNSEEYVEDNKNPEDKLMSTDVKRAHTFDNSVSVGMALTNEADNQGDAQRPSE